MIEMKDLNQVERIKVKLNLAKNTDSFLEVFGADTHKYRLDSPIDMAEVEAFEKKYNISLPDGYRVFVTQIGNGGNERKSQVGNSGAGPSYGIYKLGYKSHFIADLKFGYLEKEPFFNSKTTKEDWEAMSENMPEDISDDEYDKEFARVYAGILTIGASGCAGYMGIMLSGENTGRVVYIYDEIEYCPQFATEANFLDWYENWLDSIISGQRFDRTQAHDTPDERFERYANVGNVHKNNVLRWKIVALEDFKAFDSLSSEHIERMWEIYNTEANETAKLYILNLLVKFDYENTKPELSKLYKNNALEFLKILHLYAAEKTIEWQNTIQKLQEETLNPDVTEYVQYVTMNDLIIKTI